MERQGRRAREAGQPQPRGRRLRPQAGSDRHPQGDRHAQPRLRPQWHLLRGHPGGRLVQQARDLAYKWQMAGPDGTFTTDFITTGTQAATEGFLSSFGAPPADSTPELRAFYDKYKAKFGKDPDPAAVSGYDM